MINIAFCINNITNNGPGKVVLNIIKGLDKQKYKIYLITLFAGNDQSIINSLIKENIIVKEMNYQNRMDFVLFKLKGLSSYLKQEKICIVHSHGIIPDYAISRIRLKIKKISTIHCNMFEDYNSYGKVKKIIMIFMHIKSLKKFDKCICCSRSVYNAIKNKLSNSAYVVNGIDLDLKNTNKVSRKKLGIPNDANVYIYAGVLKKGKRVEELIRMFKKAALENDFLLILGNGEKYNACIELSSKDENIKILGFKKNVEDYFQISDVYCSNSKSEGMSISIIEAMTTGLHLFLSDIPSHSEALSFDENYYIGETFNEKNFADKFKQIKNNLDKNNKNKIIEYQEKYLSSKSMSDGYDVIYSEIMGNLYGKS